VAGLIGHFDEVLADLEAAAGWRTARLQRPVVIFGSLDGILTTVRNHIRAAPLETTEVTIAGASIRVPTKAEILRIKAWLIVQRNATRDFLDVAAIAASLTERELLAALAPMDRLYPQPGDRGAVRQQLMRQLALPRPSRTARSPIGGPFWRASGENPRGRSHLASRSCSVRRTTQRAAPSGGCSSTGLARAGSS